MAFQSLKGDSLTIEESYVIRFFFYRTVKVPIAIIAARIHHTHTRNISIMQDN